MATPEPGRQAGWRRVMTRIRAGERAAAAWWRLRVLPALGRGSARLRAGVAALGPSHRYLAVRGRAVLGAVGRGIMAAAAWLRARAAALGPPARRLAVRGRAGLGAVGRAAITAAARLRDGAAAGLRYRRPVFRPGPLLAALPPAGLGAALAGSLTVGELASVGAVVAAVAAGAWVTGECLAAALRAAEEPAWPRAAMALGAGLALGLVTYLLALTVSPSMALWAAAAPCLVMLGLWASPAVPEAHLAWAVALAFLPALGWEAAGGTGPAPIIATGWALLLAGGHALVRAAARGGPAARFRLGAARLCHLASPFPLLSLVGERPMGLAFVAGVTAAGLLTLAGHLFARGRDSAPGAGLTVSLTLGGVAVVAGILLGSAGWPR